MNSMAMSTGFNGAISTHNRMGESLRFMTKKEFKNSPESLGLKGNALTRAYNDYIKTNGKRASGAVVAQVNNTGALAKSMRVYKNGNFSVNFVIPENLKERKTKGRTITADQIKETLASLSDKDKAALLAELQQA